MEINKTPDMAKVALAEIAYQLPCYLVGEALLKWAYGLEYPPRDRDVYRYNDVDILTSNPIQASRVAQRFGAAVDIRTNPLRARVFFNGTKLDFVANTPESVHTQHGGSTAISCLAAGIDGNLNFDRHGLPDKPTIEFVDFDELKRQSFSYKAGIVMRILWELTLKYPNGSQPEIHLSSKQKIFIIKILTRLIDDPSANTRSFLSFDGLKGNRERLPLPIRPFFC